MCVIVVEARIITHAINNKLTLIETSQSNWVNKNIKQNEKKFSIFSFFVSVQ